MDQKALTDFDKQLICAALSGVAGGNHTNYDTAIYAVAIWKRVKEELEREGYRAD